MSAKKTRNKPIKLDDDLGAKLYGPTPSNPKFRLDYTDPLTGQRCQPRRTHKGDAFALWDEVTEYLSTARYATRVVSATEAGLAVVDRSGGPIVDDLFAKLQARWQRLHRSPRYIQNRSNLYENRIHPVIGTLGVRAWGTSTEHCEIIVGNALTDGLAPASVQNVGSLMRGLVSQARRERWLPRSADPMEDVPYVAPPGEQGQGRAFVLESDRPSTAAVERLLDAYDVVGEHHGIPWLADRAATGAFGGLRPSEQDALRINDLGVVPGKPRIRIDETFTCPRGRKGEPPLSAPTKNRRTRLARMPRSRYERLVARAELLRAAGLADDALLFADPCDPYRPLGESLSRRLFIEAALSADWETVAVKRSKTAKRDLGPDRRPRHVYYTLRHHSVGWMLDVVGMNWPAISRTLGHHSVAFTHAVYERSDSDADDRIDERLEEL
jgi:integrase